MICFTVAYLWYDGQEDLATRFIIYSKFSARMIDSSIFLQFPPISGLFSTQKKKYIKNLI